MMLDGLLNCINKYNLYVVVGKGGCNYENDWTVCAVFGEACIIIASLNSAR